MQTPTHPPSFTEATATFAHIGLLSFGGPAAQIALMHRVIVDDKKWLSEREYLDALGFCMLLPGPEAMQLATYAGWKLHGLRGGLMAGLLFVIPGALVVLALSMIYAAFGKVPLVEALFLGVKAAVLVIVIEALLRVAKRALSKAEHWLIAALSFVAIFFFQAPFPLIVALATLFGFVRLTSASSQKVAAVDTRVPLSQTLRTALVWLAIWVIPLGTMTVLLGQSHLLSQMAWFFSKLAVVTFGGAYAVLAYMGQDVVQAYNWLTAGEMMDGLGLAETTPGPLILVTEFVGFLAAFKQGGWLLGLAGALVALWSTFAPCFLWIFAGAPYIAWLGTQPRLKGALTAIMAAVVGVILNLAVWFALHVLFAKVDLVSHGWLKLWTPTVSSLDWRVVLLSVVSGVLLLWRHWGIPAVLGVASMLAVGLHLMRV
jgi:chromate transporter